MVTGSLHLEEFTPGQTFSGEHFELTADYLTEFGHISGDRHPMHTPGRDHGDELSGQGPIGIARYFGTVYDSGILADTVIAALDTHWYYRAPLRVGAVLHYETLITGWRRTSDPSRGVLHRHVRLLDAQGALVQEGRCAVLVRALSPGPRDDDPPESLPLDVPWARAVVSRLEDTSEFHDSTQLFDGTIGLAGDAAEVQLRIYKGQVIDIAKRTPRGADFTLRGGDEHWCGLLTGERNDFVVRANHGEFSVAGDAYAYLQLTKALHLIVDAARTLHGRGGAA